MTDKLKQKMEEEIMKLPKERQGAINAFDWSKVTEEIGKRHLLTESELNDFQLETGLVLLGLIDLDSYALNIENNVGTTQEESKKMSIEVFNEIFTPISRMIESSVKIKNPNWNQRINFIISGGDYSTYIE
jgi:hypothetical protein